MTPARILIVEDDRVVARDIQQQLSRIGHAVVGMTARGEDALPLAQSTQPELVLMDIRLEGAVDGVDAAQQIHEHCHIPVVFLTAYADDETVERASITEPFGYILKPFEDSQLRTVIEMALYKHTAERKLRESESRFVTTLSSIGDAVIAADDRALVTFMNPVAEALTGWPQGDAVGRPLAEVFRIVNEETRQTVEDPAAQVLWLGAIVELADHTTLLARDGREVPIDNSSAPIIDDHGGVTGAVLVFRDITRRRQVEDALRKAQAELAHVTRVTTLGELAASIAHEVNQPLTSIVINGETCLQWLNQEPPELDETRSSVESMISDAKLASEVILRIRALSKKTKPENVPLDINDVIREVVRLVRREVIGHGASLRLELAPALPSVVGDRVQLQQVIINLVINAIQAMASVTDRPRGLMIRSQQHEARHVLVAVLDAGIGLDPEHVNRLFNAFFTTKSGGMGMGLSICRSIIEAHGGRISASNNPGPGATFQFTLPASEESVS